MDTPQVRVGLAVFICKDGKFLMMKRRGSHGSGTWAPPGGHVEFGESFEDTARREAKEETDLTLKNIRFGTVTNDPLLSENKHYVTIWMLSEVASGKEYIMEPNKCDSMQWCDVASLPSPLFYNWQTMIESGFLETIKKAAERTSAT
jgi:8-oxo-dGTP diphosphatase